MKITKRELGRIIRGEVKLARMHEGAVPAAGRYGMRVESVRDQLARLGSKISVLWDEISDITDHDTADMLDTSFDEEAFRDMLSNLDDQLVELQVALYDVDSGDVDSAVVNRR